MEIIKPQTDASYQDDYKLRNARRFVGRGAHEHAGPGGLDMLQPSRGRMLSRAAAHALSGTMAMTLLAITGIAVFIPDRLNVSVGGVGHRALVRRRSILPGPATRLL